MSFKKLLKPAAPLPRLLLNVGGGVDLISGYFMKGKYNEDILIGGFSHLQGESGEPNNEKTTMALWMMMSALDTVAYSYASEMMVYDSEGTLRYERINDLSKRYKYLDRNEFGELEVSFDNIASMTPEEWYDKKLAPYIKQKRDADEYLVPIEFLKDPNTGKELKLKLPTAFLIDTLTYFDPSTTADLIMGDNKGKSDSAGNSNDKSNKMFGMANAKFKTDVMSTMTAATLRTNTYGLFVAHVGDNISIENSPYGPKPRQQIGSLSSNEKFKGVPANFTRILTSLWQAKGKKKLFNSAGDAPEYPLGNGNDSVRNEIYIVTLKQHRSKDNLSDVTIDMIVSQKEGVLPHLSQFHYLRKNKLGLQGNNVTYNLTLYPGVKLTRPTVRGLIDEDAKLRRAIELTSDYYQLEEYYKQYNAMGLYCGLETLYKDIDELGYDWDKILTLTRNWHTPKQYSSELQYLHMLNLLKIRKGLYENKQVLKLISKDSKKEK